MRSNRGRVSWDHTSGTGCHSARTYVEAMLVDIAALRRQLRHRTPTQTVAAYIAATKAVPWASLAAPHATTASCDTCAETFNTLKGFTTTAANADCRIVPFSSAKEVRRMSSATESCNTD